MPETVGSGGRNDMALARSENDDTSVFTQGRDGSSLRLFGEILIFGSTLPQLTSAKVPSRHLAYTNLWYPPHHTRVCTEEQTYRADGRYSC